MKPQSSAEELLARVAQRDSDALAEVYDQFAPILLGLVVQILNDRSAAEDIVEEVFYHFWGHAPHFGREGTSLAMGLMLAARARAVDRLRSQKGLPPLDRLGGGRKMPPWLPRAAEVEHLENRLELLRKVLNQLPKPQRRMLELAVFEGSTEREIAAQLGEPAARVVAGMLAAMRFLRHRLDAVMGTWTANI